MNMDDLFADIKAFVNSTKIETRTIDIGDGTTMHIEVTLNTNDTPKRVRRMTAIERGIWLRNQYASRVNPK